MRKLLALAADAMAGFLDLAMGALIAFIIAKFYGFEAPLWHLAVGAVLAFLPDLDALRMFVRQGVQTATGDHRLTLMHRPLIILPLCIALAAVVGGKYWAVVTMLCLLWHYIHDSRWLSVSDIDWLWPITHRELPYMDHPEWRKRYWLRPTTLSVIEVGSGILISTYLASLYISVHLAALVGALLLLGAVGTWLVQAATKDPAIT